MFLQAGYRSLLFISVFLVTSCAFYPATSKLQEHGDCRMATRSLELDYTEISMNGCPLGSSSSNMDGEMICLAAMGVVIPVGSLVVSGSIVLVGNTMHWLEYHGTCDDGLLWSYIEGSK